jgi:thioredoxin reductase (NADPH)
MELALAPLLAEFGAQLQVLDVDADPLLEERYDELVPVLLKGNGQDHQEICHYFLDQSAVKTYLAG